MEKGRSWPSFHIPDDIDTPYLTKALLLTAGKLKLGSIDFQKGGSKETETEKKESFLWDLWHDETKVSSSLTLKNPISVDVTIIQDYNHSTTAVSILWNFANCSMHETFQQGKKKNAAEFMRDFFSVPPSFLNSRETYKNSMYSDKKAESDFCKLTSLCFVLDPNSTTWPEMIGVLLSITSFFEEVVVVYSITSISVSSSWNSTRN